jgi:hypothetical protein
MKRILAACAASLLLAASLAQATGVYNRNVGIVTFNNNLDTIALPTNSVPGRSFNRVLITPASGSKTYEIYDGTTTPTANLLYKYVNGSGTSTIDTGITIPFRQNLTFVTTDTTCTVILYSTPDGSI